MLLWQSSKQHIMQSNLDMTKAWSNDFICVEITSDTIDVVKLHVRCSADDTNMASPC